MLLLLTSHAEYFARSCHFFDAILGENMYVWKPMDLQWVELYCSSKPNDVRDTRDTAPPILGTMYLAPI